MPGWTEVVRVLEPKRDHYEVRSVPRHADRKTIKDAFRRLALKYHPDRNTAPEAEDELKELAEAYGVLSDPKRRADYDAPGQIGVAGMTPGDLFGGIDFEVVSGGLGYDFGRDLSGRFFGNRPRWPASDPGGQPGGLFVILSIAPAPRFQRRGANLWRSETIEVWEAAPGARNMVPALDGNASTTVPPGTHPDTVLRLKGEGLPEFRRGGRGDVLVRLRVRVPKRMTDEERALYERLKAAAGKRLTYSGLRRHKASGKA